MEIDVNNTTRKRIGKFFLRNVAEKVLEKEKKNKFSLSIALVGEKEIRSINKTYRGEDKKTDVLSFAESETEEFQDKNFLGEVVICPFVVKGGKREIARVLIHGILHLLGYDHEKNSKQAKIMKNKENQILSKLF